MFYVMASCILVSMIHYPVKDLNLYNYKFRLSGLSFYRLYTVHHMHTYSCYTICCIKSESTFCHIFANVFFYNVCIFLMIYGMK